MFGCSVLSSPSHSLWKSRALTRQNVNNDVSKEFPIDHRRKKIKAVRGKKDEEFETGNYFKFQILISKLLDHLDRKIEIIANHKFLDTLKQIMLFVIVAVANDMHQKVDTSVKNMSGIVTTK